MPKPKSHVITFPRGLVSPLSPYAGQHVRGLLNAWIAPDDWGAIEPMPGFSEASSGTAADVNKMNAIALGHDTTDYSVKLYAAGVRGVAADVAVFEVGSSSYTARKTGLDVDATVHATQIRNKLVFVNGVDAPFQIDLATDAVTDLDLTQEDVSNAATSLNAGGGDNVRGLVKYWVAPWADPVEGPLSLAFGEIDCADGNRVDVDLSHADFNATRYFRIYRTSANGHHPRMVTANFDSNGDAGIFTDDVHDNDLGDLPYLHGDAPPSELISIVTQFNRLWGITKKGVLYWSDLIDHKSWWTASNGNWTPIYEDDGDEATGLALAPDGIYVFKKAHIYHVYAQNLDGMQITPISLAGTASRSLGADRQQGIVSTRNGVAFYHDANVYVLRGFEATHIGDAISEDLRGALAFTPTISLGYSDRNSHLWVSLMDDGVSYVYDFQRNSWIGSYGFGFRGFAESASAFYAAGGGAGTQTIAAHSLYLGTTDHDGSDIPVTVELAPFFAGNPMSDKQWNSVDILVNRESVDSDISVIGIFDSDIGNPVSVTVPLDEAGSTQQRLRRRVHYGLRSRELTLKITSAAAGPQWKLYGVAPQWHEFEQSARRA